jgi:hypothetical protein
MFYSFLDSIEKRTHSPAPDGALIATIVIFMVSQLSSDLRATFLEGILFDSFTFSLCGAHEQMRY